MNREEMNKQAAIGIVITGACGRMGSTIRELASRSGDFIVKALIEKEGHSSIGKRTSLGEAQKNFDMLISARFPDSLSSDDIVIDFSTRDALPFLIGEASRKGLKYVCGTTGLRDKDTNILRKYSKNRAVFYDSNMSYGIGVVRKLLRKLSELLLGEFDVEIIEQHHRYKKDRPSGTAISLARELEGRMKQNALDDAGENGDRRKIECPIHSIRAGGITGEHKVIFASDEEIITLGHRAIKREVFARGALRAASFLSSREDGFFSMQDLLSNGKNQ